MSTEHRFPSKLLIAGEFTVLVGGDALAIPLNRFGGTWKQLPEANPELIPFGKYLKQAAFLNSDQLNQDLEDGWQFISNIPMGYGLGSSGALSAAVYDHYKNQTESDIRVIQSQLAFMENFFHGKSSGFDPLISYKKQGFIILDKKIQPLNSIASGLKNIPLYLLDSGISRGEIDSISWFYKEMEKPLFQDKIIQLTAYNRELIFAWYDLEIGLFPELFRRISEIQFELFQPLITDTVKKNWEQGLQSDQFAIKLCGKGGGGYYQAWINEPDTDLLKGLTKVSVF